MGNSTDPPLEQRFQEGLVVAGPAERRECRLYSRVELGSARAARFRNRPPRGERGLQQDPQMFANKMFRFLGLNELELEPELLTKRMPAGTPRSRLLVNVAKNRNGC